MKRSMPRFDIVGQLGSLRRYAHSLTRDSADAEDLVHDALVRAYERRGTFRAGGNLRAWLLSIVHNAFIDRLRSRRSEAARLEQVRHLADGSTQAPQEHSVRLAQIREAFFELPDEQRSALHRRGLAGERHARAGDQGRRLDPAAGLSRGGDPGAQDDADARSHAIPGRSAELRQR
ncbi:sigma-70 family RNA polymerase sigma factor [Mesorhizobium sp. LjNodule214]|uniref:sigma-70 family RNA polymerase sigma factor n=1 Tax=Mesorhizobium sp. LjNodule214 TaxID=3342252 RepID=UPI003F504FCF